jgi:catechol 2,3-dioxygenase-like lactoylglutathione lyase family enzyme
MIGIAGGTRITEVSMRFEHFALNVPDAAAMARWYMEHCGMSAARALDRPPYTHFLADESGRVTVEIYTNPEGPIPDYSAEDPRRFHFAFAVDNAAATRDRLVGQGASVALEEHLDDGSFLVMLRDPWGIPLQLCQRTHPLASRPS